MMCQRCSLHTQVHECPITPDLSNLLNIEYCSVVDLLSHMLDMLLCRTGAIDAAEFADRFFSIFAATPPQITDELFIQMALILPTADRRVQLLKLARNVSWK